MKTLMVYYSYTQNTGGIARRVREALGCDVAEIQTVSPYEGDYDSVVEQGRREVEADFCPDIRPLGVELSGYDRIILGIPVWWYTMAPAMRTFLTENGLAGKTVIPLVTSGGWPGHTVKDVEALCPGARVEKGVSLTFNGARLATPERELENWIQGLK